jgi:ABC-2 type transport system permease protein
MYLLYWLVSPIVYLSVWSAVANAQGDVKGLTANDFVTYYMTMLVVDVLVSDITLHILAYKIQDGTLSGDLIKPVHPVLTAP